MCGVCINALCVVGCGMWVGPSHPVVGGGGGQANRCFVPDQCCLPESDVL